ncbi:class I SAM-dependent methyltransferase [Mesorhizobium sp. B2-1-8]|uniref:class I SAM-dependent methyltransferase n=1 Tax=Mesorhizobium sp. B2-1-8 TaxID=2589967 RepID=UPI00112985F1|nr:class I SAM-dependent methyltransferase [Mesorhizobium sp. B2-1-8]UCI17968.1 class I SAM-dependent methyltransferase [Mesorhizobium sp. B2-1-8]
MLTPDHAIGVIEKLDISIFKVKTETTLSDRKSFLRVQNFVRSVLGRYVYLEVGSHLGGSLFPHLIDPACEAVISIDPRPLMQPDERAQVFHYPENSTARMIATLSDWLPPEAMAKLATLDSDVSNVIPGTVKASATHALIDGEHTNKACFSDFVGTLPLMKSDCVIAFHDANLIADAIMNAERLLDHLGIPHMTVFLPDTVAVMGLGSLASAVQDQLQPHALDRQTYLDRSQRQLWSQITKVHSPAIEAEIARMHSDNTKLTEEINSLRQDNLHARAHLAAMISSTTWRTSAPIRAVVDRIKRRFAR